uniref:S-adenosylmethionine decarboxylase n=1 Tax=uncultured marine group II/III euryarchaeote KM3_94_C01 TaxID=1456545 RepID=A0A075I1S7_9EURY|nr:S-adenosylmethionine decarboxylase [uncultured marine group II/III euryarchaeote KM3_94_C01]
MTNDGDSEGGLGGGGVSDGKHVTLDYIGYVSPNGNDAEWMLALLSEAAAKAGAREVHAHAESFDGSVSPPGFAAVVLLDESHVSAHCYSERGLLAIDAFTCGDADPNQITDHLHEVLTKSIPGIKLVRKDSLNRFLNGD